jgi:valyl-tRNA synthetase
LWAIESFVISFGISLNSLLVISQQISSQEKMVSNQNLEDYKFGDYSNNLYEFWKKELADVYLEAIKPVVKSGNSEAALNTLYLVLDACLKLLHPAMPYITEELYQRLPHLKMSDSICIAEFP